MKSYCCKLSKLLFVLVCAVCATNAYSWTYHAHFNDGEVGVPASGKSDGFSGDAKRSIYDREVAYEGGQSAKLHIGAGETGFGDWGGVIVHPEDVGRGGEIWFRVRTFMPQGFNYDSTSGGNRLKFLRIHTRSESNTNQGYNDWYIDPRSSSRGHRFICECENVWSDVLKEHSPVLGKWETYEMYVKLHNVPLADGGEAVVRLWKDGELIKEITDRKTLAASNSYSDRTHLFTFWNGGAPKTQHMWVDDIILTTNRPLNTDAHGNSYVGVGDAPEFSDSASFGSPPLAPSGISIGLN